MDRQEARSRWTSFKEVARRKEEFLCQQKKTKNSFVVLLSAGIRETSRSSRSSSPPTSFSMILTDPTFAVVRTTNAGSPRPTASSPTFISQLRTWSLKQTEWWCAGPFVAPIPVISRRQRPLLRLVSRKSGTASRAERDNSRQCSKIFLYTFARFTAH